LPWGCTIQPFAPIQRIKNAQSQHTEKFSNEGKEEEDKDNQSKEYKDEDLINSGYKVNLKKKNNNT
jgi:hypothetical protein